MEEWHGSRKTTFLHYRQGPRFLSTSDSRPGTDGPARTRALRFAGRLFQLVRPLLLGKGGGDRGAIWGPRVCPLQWATCVDNKKKRAVDFSGATFSLGTYTIKIKKQQNTEWLCFSIWRFYQSTANIGLCF